MDRIYLALELPDPHRGVIGQWQRSAVAGTDLRPVPVSELALVLLFLGRLKPGTAAQIADRLRQVQLPRIEATLAAAPLVLPDSEQPGLCLLPARCQGLGGLIRVLRQEVGALIPALAAQRLPRAHLPLLRGGPRRPGSRVAVARPPQLPAEVGRPFEAVRATLYRSETIQQGPRSTRLAQVELSPTDSGEVIN